MGAHGAVAQLGERLHGMQEVVGSSPIGSIHTRQSVQDGMTSVFLNSRPDVHPVQMEMTHEW